MSTPLLHPECVSCLIKKQIDVYPKSASREQALTYMRRLGELMAALPDRAGGPVIMEAITDIRREVFGPDAASVERDYGAVKTHFNRLMTDVVASAEIYSRVFACDDPLRAALGYAMTGNFIDFGAMDSVDEGKLRALLDTASERVDAVDPAYRSLKRDLSEARRLAILTDNCGEIVLDKLLTAVIHALYPDLAITVLVRGGDVLNDATMEDAAQVGFDRMEGVRVLGNGDRLAGTDIDRISPEAREVLVSADLILAKGQGNYETLRGCGLPVYYAFLCKCRFFADRFGVPVYTGMLVMESKGESTT